MSGSISQVSNQQQNYAVSGGSGQDQEVQQLEQVVQELLNALQSGGGGSQGTGQTAGQYAGGGAGDAGNGQSPVSEQPLQDASLQVPTQSGGDAQTQSLEAAVQQLLNALEQQDGGQGAAGGVGQYAGGTGGTGGAGGGTDGAAGMGQGITPPDMSDLQVGSTGSQTQSLEQAAQQLLNA
ncbi:MAG: hypothetical protein INR65_20650, partial [Gluconacetobacter diazotrophicus]|nr:hypothetical protein [Gluconacetobacter diazotrophicus]